MNLNARVYDPIIGRFVSADPVIGNLFDQQQLNRYSYVLNNPLSLIDPNGMCGFWCILEDVVALVVAIAVPEFLADAEDVVSALGLELPDLSAVNVAIGGGLSGLISSGNLKGAAFSAAEAVGFYYAGNIVGSVNPDGTHPVEGAATAFITHGLVGGLDSVATTGRFGSGFLAGGVGSLADIQQFNQSLEEGVVVHAIASGIGSEIAGGSFENGAITGAFGYLYNWCMHQVCAPNHLMPQGRFSGLGGTDVPATFDGGDINIEPIQPGTQVWFSGIFGGIQFIGGVTLGYGTYDYEGENGYIYEGHFSVVGPALGLSIGGNYMYGTSHNLESFFDWSVSGTLSAGGAISYSGNTSGFSGSYGGGLSIGGALDFPRVKAVDEPIAVGRW